MLPVQVGSSNDLQFSAFNPSLYAAAAPSKGKSKKKPAKNTKNKKRTPGKSSPARDIISNPPTNPPGGGQG